MVLEHTFFKAVFLDNHGYEIEKGITWKDNECKNTTFGY